VYKDHASKDCRRKKHEKKEKKTTEKDPILEAAKQKQDSHLLFEAMKQSKRKRTNLQLRRREELRQSLTKPNRRQRKQKRHMKRC
jgi:hypothetical protein